MEDWAHLHDPATTVLKRSAFASMDLLELRVNRSIGYSGRSRVSF